jgi:hypothetical protein
MKMLLKALPSEDGIVGGLGLPQRVRPVGRRHFYFGARRI